MFCGVYRTRSPPPFVIRWTNSAFAFSVHIVVLLLIVLPLKWVISMVLLTLGEPQVTWCWGVASGTNRLKNPDTQPHGKILKLDKFSLVSIKIKRFRFLPFYSQHDSQIARYYNVFLILFHTLYHTIGNIIWVKCRHPSWK